jgi:WD40 repeat protein
LLRAAATKRDKLCRHRRSGLIYMVALRELLMISAGVALVIAVLWQASATFQMHMASHLNNDDVSASPVTGFNIDRDQRTLIAVTWPGDLKKISLDTGLTVPLNVPRGLVSAVSSARNSTTVLLAEWSEEYEIHHRVDVIRHEEVILSEEFIFESLPEADAFVSQDGRIAMMISSGGQVIGWDLTEVNPVRWEFTICRSFSRCSLSPDGHFILVTGDQKSLLLCDSRTGHIRIELSDSDIRCKSVDWTSDGKRLAVGDESGGLQIFDTVSGQRIWHQKLDFEFALAVAFSTDGTRLATGGFDHTIRVWDLSQPEKKPLELVRQKGVVRNLIFASTDETLFSGSLDGSIHEWSLATGLSTRQIY